MWWYFAIFSPKTHTHLKINTTFLGTEDKARVNIRDAHQFFSSAAVVFLVVGRALDTSFPG
jgi:hypothetical protein